MVIISVLTVIALPQIKKSLRSTTISRATNIVTGSFMNARTLASQTGRPYGVRLRRLRRDLYVPGQAAINDSLLAASNQVHRISYVQVPPTYGGDTSDARAYLFATATVNGAGECVYRHAFFFPRSEAGLLYAAASGQPTARALINRGAAISIGVRQQDSTTGRFSIQGRTSRIVDFTAVSPGWRGGIARHASCGRADTADTIPDALNTFGTIIYTDDQYVSSFQTDGPPIEDDADFEGVPIGSAATASPRANDTQAFEIEMLPAPAALTALDMPGKAVIDLSLSGGRDNPIVFSTQSIIARSGLAPSTDPDNRMHDVLIMFDADGQIESMYYDELVDDGSGAGLFQLTRHDPPTSLSLLVGYSDKVLVDLTTLNRTGATLDALEDTNLLNPECSWATVTGSSGAYRIDNVASQPSDTFIAGFHSTTVPAPPAASDVEKLNVVRNRVSQSRRFIYGSLGR